MEIPKEFPYRLRKVISRGESVIEINEYDTTETYIPHTGCNTKNSDERIQ